jgi:hypothetical protein
MSGSGDVAARRGTDAGTSSQLALLAVALAPVPAFVVTTATGYADPVFANPPGVLGFPLGIVLLFLAAALTALALVTASRRRPGATGRARTLAFAVPALVIVLLSPPVIEWMTLLG